MLLHKLILIWTCTDLKVLCSQSKCLLMLGKLFCSITKGRYATHEKDLANRCHYDDDYDNIWAIKPAILSPGFRTALLFFYFGAEISMVLPKDLKMDRAELANTSKKTLLPGWELLPGVSKQKLSSFQYVNQQRHVNLMITCVYLADLKAQLSLLRSSRSGLIHTQLHILRLEATCKTAFSGE